MVVGSIATHRMALFSFPRPVNWGTKCLNIVLYAGNSENLYTYIVFNLPLFYFRGIPIV